MKVDYTFEPGDVVQLKSGSVPMTVNTIKEDKAEVVYFDWERMAPMSFEIPVICLEQSETYED